MDDLLAEFLTETTESLGELDVAVVQLERVPGHAPTIASVFRLVHTIKGTCGFLGLGRLEKVAHAAENVLGRLRDGELTATPGIITVILAALDQIKAIVGSLSASGTEPVGDDTPLIARLERAEQGIEDEVSGTPASAPTPAPAPAAVASPALAPVSVAAAPVSAAPVSPAPVSAAPAAPHPEPESSPTSHTIRVTVDVLENLMTLVSELVLTRNQLLQIARVQGQRGEESTAFTTPLQRLSQITSDLQEGVMKTRMQPVGNAWNKLPRVVRDLSIELGKKIDLVMEGAETELDRQVLELIRDPLTHMVRNSADHGIETPAVRRAAGKLDTGRIRLTACHEGGHIVIEIADDGKGLDTARIRAKAVARGIASEAEVAAMSEADVHRFIFHPGFSTAEAVTSVSGRGVGMDVVMTNIQRIGGAVDMASRPGEGSTFTIKIPLTLAIVSALIVEAGGERFAIPQLTVAELVSARPAGAGTASEGESVIESLNGTPILRLRDRLLPLVSLSQLLRLDGPASSESTGHPGAARHVIVAQGGGVQIGIAVDRVFDTEEIVVKPVAPILRHLTVFGGNTILGDGSVIMILDPTGIARAAGIAADGRGEERRSEGRTGVAAQNVSRSDANTAILLFRVDGALMAVPLALIARLEEIPRERIEYTDMGAAGSSAVTQYRGQLMPLLPIGANFDRAAPLQRVLVFSGDRDGGAEAAMGLVVDEIVDVVDEKLRVALSSTKPGVLGTAVIAGQAAAVLDTGHWLKLGNRDWFRARPAATKASQRQPRILVVEDSDFFRQLLIPTLSTAGYVVTAAGSAAQALRLRDGGAMFEAIVSDIEMPDLDGNALVRSLRAGGPWAHLPMVALSGRARPQDIAAARDAGFTDFVEKFEPEPLLASLKQVLANAAAPASAEAA